MDRRTFVCGSLATAVLLSTNVIASDVVHVDPETDTTAVALQYVTDATTSEADKYEAGQQCAGCVFYQGVDGDEYGACGVFTGKVVKSAGWCNAWTKKA